MMMKTVFLFLAGVVALNAAPVAAQTVSVRVAYADLNLTSAGGVKLLDRRIADAVRRICGAPTQIDLSAARGARNCARDVMATTRPQIDRALASARNGTRLAAR